MKRIFHTLTFIGKALLLVVLLLVGWVFINATNLIKGKKTAHNDQNNTDNPGGFNWANADIGPPISCPFIAVYDGAQYRLENDFLFGKPRAFFTDRAEGKKAYANKNISPDLYKMQGALTPQHGKLLMQIQEIEPEESFIGNFSLERVTHPEYSEIITDADRETYRVVERAVFEKGIILPHARAISHTKNEDISSASLIWKNDIQEDPHLFFHQPGDSRTFRFQGLNQKEKTYLVIKSRYRDYNMSSPPEKIEKITLDNIFKSIPPRARKAAAASLLFLTGLWLQKKIPGINLVYTTIPMFFGVQAPHCFVYEYKSGIHYRPIGIYGVRAWKYNTELIEIPQNAIHANGEARIKVTAAQRHALGFIGIIQNAAVEKATQKQIHKEKITLSSAYHQRLEKEVGDTLNGKRGNELIHTIPGDKIDIEFNAPAIPPQKNEKETYLLRTSGFFTPLSPEAATRAGNWKENLSDEAKIHTMRLTELNHTAPAL